MSVAKIPVDVLREIAANCLMMVPAVRSMRVRRGRTIAQDPREQAKRVIQRFEFFSARAGDVALRNRTVLELGPGDGALLGMLFVGAGARQYIAFDRFLHIERDQLTIPIIDAVADLAPDSIKRGWEKAGLDPRQYPWLAGADPRVIGMNSRIEDGPRHPLQPVDLICSYNVLEHLSELRAAIGAMKALLSSDGRMIHRVDYGPHDVWTTYRDPLTFLAFPQALWRSMGSHRGYPNRLRHSQVVGLFREAGLSVEREVTESYAPGRARESARRLARRYRVDSQDLLISTAEFECSSPP